MLGSWFFCRWLPQPPAPLRPACHGIARRATTDAAGSGIFTAVCVWRWRRCVKVFLQISPLFCGKICKKLCRGLPHWGMTIASYLRNFLPPYPYLSCRWHAGWLRGTVLVQLFYSSWAFERGSQAAEGSKRFCPTGQMSPTSPTNQAGKTKRLSHDAPTFSQYSQYSWNSLPLRQPSLSACRRDYQKNPLFKSDFALTKYW